MPMILTGKWVASFCNSQLLVISLSNHEDLAEASLFIHKKCDDGQIENMEAQFLKTGKTSVVTQPAMHRAKAGVSKTYTWCIGSVRKIQQY